MVVEKKKRCKKKKRKKKGVKKGNKGSPAALAYSFANLDSIKTWAAIPRGLGR